MLLFNAINNKNYISGEWQEFPSQIVVTNPATEEVIGAIPNLSNQEITKSIDATAQGFEIWSQTSLEQRANILTKWHQEVESHIDEIAHIITLEQGKVLSDAKKEISYGLSFIKWFVDIINNIEGTIRPGSSYSHKMIMEYEPVGPVAAITPWNFPAAMVMRKISPALAAGCSVLLKPSELTPFTALMLAKLIENAGLPAGVLNVITGEANIIGKIICDDFRIRKLSFTGSTRVGKILYQNSASTLKRLSLELGGNAPFIICADCDLEKTAADLIAAKIRAVGQACTSPNRIFIEAAVYDKFVEIVSNKFADIRVGNGLDPKSDIGPLINKAAIEKISQLISDATGKGAKVIIGGKSVANFFEPTVISNCTDNMEIFTTEIFGPVIACYKFNNFEEVITRANNTEYGLQAYVYSRNISLAQNLSAKLDFGMVSINASLPSNAQMAFGGRKASGFGVEGSDKGLFEYLNIKYINLQTDFSI